MKKKYKIKYRPIIILIFLILIVFCCIRFYSKGYTSKYRIGEEKYEVTETYTKNVKGEVDNYYIEIVMNNIPYGFQFYHTFGKKRKVLDDVITYQGDYQCLLPIIDGKAQTDLLCYKDHRYYFYSYIIGKEERLDQFVDDIDIEVYDRDDWLNQSTDNEIKGSITLYPRNVVENHYVFISNLRGAYQITNDVKEIELFHKDVYQRDLSTFVSHYYITADYSESGHFRTFYFVDMITRKVESEKAPNYISFDSYIQGIVDNQLYIYDKDNEKQYRISPKRKSIEEIGNSKKKIQYYRAGNWEKITPTKANKTVLFETEIKDFDFQKYAEVYHVGGESSGYYYLLEKTDIGYRLYRTPSQNKKMITYITTVSDITNICFIDDYVYFQEEGKLKYYHDETGIRTLLEYSELEFNKHLIFGVTTK